MEDVNGAMVAEVEVECCPELSKSVSKEKKKLLQDMVENTESDLSPTQRDQLHDVLLEFADVFAGPDDDSGHTSSIKHQIDTGSATPIRQPVRRVPSHRREIVRNLLDEMHEKKVIQPSESLGIPHCLVQKKDG